MKKLLGCAMLFWPTRAALAEETLARNPFALPAVWWIVLIVAALLIALIVVSVLRGQLRTAAPKDGAADYIRAGSLDMTIERNHFLYRQVTKRKIEQKKD